MDGSTRRRNHVSGGPDGASRAEAVAVPRSGRTLAVEPHVVGEGADTGKYVPVPASQAQQSQDGRDRTTNCARRQQRWSGPHGRRSDPGGGGRHTARELLALWPGVGPGVRTRRTGCRESSDRTVRARPQAPHRPLSGRRDDLGRGVSSLSGGLRTPRPPRGRTVGEHSRQTHSTRRRDSTRHRRRNDPRRTGFGRLIAAVPGPGPEHSDCVGQHSLLRTRRTDNCISDASSRQLRVVAAAARRGDSGAS